MSEQETQPTPERRSSGVLFIVCALTVLTAIITLWTNSDKEADSQENGVVQDVGQVGSDGAKGTSKP